MVIKKLLIGTSVFHPPHELLAKLVCRWNTGRLRIILQESFTTPSHGVALGSLAGETGDLKGI